MEQIINKHDTVALRDFPGSNLLKWDYGTVIKLSMDEDEALVHSIVDGEDKYFWEYCDNLQKID